MELSYKFSQSILYLLSIDLLAILIIVYTKVIAEKNARIIKTLHLTLFKDHSNHKNNTSTNGAKPIYVGTIKSLKSQGSTNRVICYLIIFLNRKFFSSSKERTTSLTYNYFFSVTYHSIMQNLK